MAEIIAAPVLANNTVTITPGNSADLPQSGGPTNPPMSRGLVANTSIDITNNNLSHSCDFALDMKKNIGLKDFLRAIGQSIRDAVRTIRKTLGLSDASGSFSYAISKLKDISSYINWVNNNVIKPIADFEKYVLAVIIKIREVIQWILSLPAELFKLLKDCLSRLYDSLKTTFTDTFAEISSGYNEPTTVTYDDGSSITTYNDGSQIVTDAEGNSTTIPADEPVNTTDGYSALVASTKEAFTATQNLFSASANTAALAGGIAISGTIGLITPVSQTQITEANLTIEQYMSSTPSGTQPPGSPAVAGKTP